MQKFFFLLFLMFSLASYSQTYDADKVDKRAIDLYERALLRLQEDRPKEAIPLLKKAIETDGKYADAILSLASVYGELKDYKTAVQYFETGRSLDTNYYRFLIFPIL